MRVNFLLNRWNLLLFIIIILFLISKIPFLTLPFYWDEAWSYATAVFDMHDNGISLIPGSVNAEFTRGHPLLFYFCAASWTKVFGLTPLSLHLFALLIAVLTIIAFYQLAKYISNSFVAIACTLFLSVQTWFWVQSVFLLPEIFLALFTLLTVRTYLQRKWLMFCVYSTMMVLTKESGWILLIALFCFEGVRMFFIEQKRSFTNLRFLLFPLFVIITFLAIQKIRLGWFFFPGHIGMIHTDLNAVFENFTSILLTFFINKYQFLFLISVFVAILMLVRVKTIIDKQLLSFVVFSLIFILGYILFSSMNFYTTRYLICVLPFYILTSVSLFDFSIKLRWIKILTFFAFFVIMLVTTLSNKRDADFSIAYKESVLSRKAAINFCENNAWQHKSLSVAFVSRYYFENVRMGYLSDSVPFDNFVDSNSEIMFLESSDCTNEQLAEILQDTTKKIAEFKYQRGWVAVVYNKTLPIK